MNDGPAWWEWLVGLAFTTIAGLFAFTHRRIGEVQTELRDDQMEEIQALRLEISRMEKLIDNQFQQGREDRAEMWRTIQANQAAQVAQHAQNLERLSLIPTRDEMMRMLQQFVRPPTTH